jgi:hypothetical protein
MSMDDVKAKLDEFEQRLSAINKRFDDMQWVVGAIIIFFGIVITASSGLAVYLFKDQGDSQERMNTQLQNAIKEQNEKLSQDEKDIKKESDEVLGHASMDADRQTQFVSGYVNGTRSEVSNWIQISRDDYKRLEDKVDEGYGDPKIDLLGPDNRPLENGVLHAIYTERPSAIHIEVRIRNSGTGSSGPVSMRVYSNDITFPQESDDLSAGKYSAILYPSGISTNEMTGGAGLPGRGFTDIGDYNLAVRDKPSQGQHQTVIKIYYGAHRSGVAEAKVVLAIP